MSFPRYPKYKDSCVEWLGEVPTHWEIKKLKHVSPELTVGIVVEPSRFYAEEGVPALRSLNVKAGAISLENLVFITQAGHELHSKSKLRVGDIVVVRTGQPGTSAVVPEELDGCNCIDLIVIRKPIVGSERFLFWYLGSASALVQFSVGSGGAIQQHFNISTAVELIVAVPPPVEQTAIAAFLDRETAKIDALVAEQQCLIALLTEKRQAVISHAVTKGLNPDASMKPSGVDWLGEVPAHWAVIELKRIADVRTGMAKGKDHAGRSTVAVPYLRVANVQNGYLDLEEVAVMEVPTTDLARYSLKPGDVLMNEGGDFDKLGRGCVWNGQIDPCITQNHVFAVRPHSVRSEWLSAITGSDYAQFYFKTRAKQSTNLASISSTNLMELPVVLPPDDEVLRILDAIAEKTAAYDQLLSAAGSAIDLLQERRAALISAAVTGQIDVRAIADRVAA